MSLDELLDHKCDIYHILKSEVSPGWGLPVSPSFGYPESPDISSVTCHFGVRSQSVALVQTDPVNLMEASIKLTLPAGTDIRMHDKIVNCETGLEYTAELPRNIRGHHLFVWIKKKDGQTERDRQKDV